MSAKRFGPAARPAGTPLKPLAKWATIAAVILAAAALGYVVGHRSGEVHELLFARPTEAQRVAFVREEPCADKTCQTIWLGNTREDAVRVATLVPGAERCEEIAWAKDGLRVAFVINGYQLRIFDGYTRKPIRDVNVIEPDGTPTSRFVRGVTFSENGAAVTFDDCPRGRSGCKSGLAAVR
jgi:hypothetical protein